MARGVSGWITLRALLARNGGIEPKTTDADPTALHGRVASSEVCQTNKHTSEGRHILWLLSLHEHFRPFLNLPYWIYSTNCRNVILCGTVYSFVARRRPISPDRRKNHLIKVFMAICAWRGTVAAS